ncbi:preprotein translocase subunit YajC [Haloactinomyces albus]|uniref:Preprotein translocase subunit YajC n=1 Tax=Haloactinomyces albus TaxID=1352928 RepID=A0AAE3ZE50_9ACTN|nr:preprotein translocase subunit YajC [Haloactinomyces albus]MDR7303273.1 preprotein translocase subunit YajC [Haloactinomyces albus]
MEQLIFPILLVGIALMLFFQIRKQKRSMQQQQQLQNSLAEGDRVMTTSGLFGTVVTTSDDSIELEIAPGMTTTWLRQAVREKVNTDDSADSAEDVSDDETSGRETDEGPSGDTSDDRSEEQATESVEKQKAH